MKSITVKLEEDIYKEFDRFCCEKGYKKSGLLVFLLKEHLKKEGYYIAEKRTIKGGLRGTKKGKQR